MLLNRTAMMALCGLAVGLAVPAAADPVVRTDKGLIRGKDAPGVDAFLGIPFAQPPLGDLRWRDPQPVKSWHGVRAAMEFSASCMQEAPPAASPAPYTAEFVTSSPISEDCLYLNIWTPKPARRARPVLVFVHGGAFQAGSTSVPIYDGANLARAGAVIVTINYRLGVFGYLAHPQLTKESPLGSSGNYGLLDVIAALRWVRTNIARFGGDPANVTISGQSAGAIAVNDLLASPLAKGLFQQAIAESGPTLGLKMSPLAKVELGGEAFLKRAKATSIAQLRAMPAAQVSTIFRGPANPLPPFFPLPVMDGKIVISDPEISTNRIVSKVPLIVGFNRDEAPAAPTTAAKFAVSVRAAYGALADRFLAAYPHATDAEATRSAEQLSREARIAGLLDWAKRRTSASGQRVFVYLFDHPYPGVDAKRLGAFHTAEVPFIFGNLDRAAGPVTAQDRRVADQMQKRWLAFMTRGDPSLSDSPWAPVLKSPERVMYLGDNSGVRAVLPADRLALFRAYFAQKAQ